MAMKGHKKILFLSSFYLLTLQVNGQTLFTNDGTAIKIEAGVTLTIDNGGFLNKTNVADLGTIDNAGTITLTKDWENNSANGVFSTATAGIVQFIGTAAQGIGGTSGTGTDFYDLTINNTSATGVTLSQPATITNALTLTDGIVFTDATNILTMNAGSSSSPGSAISYVDGPMNKVGTTAFIFPVGDGTKWARIGIGTPTAATTFKAQYFATPYANTTSIAAGPPTVLRKISRKEYWTLDEVDPTVDATVTLYWEDASFSYINDCSTGDLKIAHWNGAAWENNNDAVTVTGTCGGATAGTISTNLDVTSFSPFTFASRTDKFHVNPLPIELLSFNAKPNGNKVDLMWVTASEINNDYFTLERTTDGVNFEVVGTVKGNGNSTKVINYSSEDNVPYSGVSYYRLKQIDFDGKFTYSDLKMISFGTDSDFSFNIYPNPNDGDVFYLKISGNNNDDISIVIQDMLGNKMYSNAFISDEGSENIHSIEPSQKLKPGIYLMSATSKDKTYNKRLVVN